VLKKKSKHELHDAPGVRQSKTLQGKVAAGKVSAALGKHLAALKDS